MSPIMFAKLMYGDKTYIFNSAEYWQKVKRSCQKVKRSELWVWDMFWSNLSNAIDHGFKESSIQVIL